MNASRITMNDRASLAAASPSSLDMTQMLLQGLEVADVSGVPPLPSLC